MIENPELTEFRLKPIDPEIVAFSEQGETAYALQQVSHGEFQLTKEAKAKLAEIIPTPSTLGFEICTECDFDPSSLTTFNADKTENASYEYGGHAPGEKNFGEHCRFKPGEKVLCVLFSGYNAVIPAIVEGPLTLESIKDYHRTIKDPLLSVLSTGEFIDSMSDWGWDSVVVRPLVRLKNDWNEMSETEIVNRVYLFPYKKFEV